MTAHSTPNSAETALTEEQIREKMSSAMAKYMCLIAGIEPVDSTDGSCNWWIFFNEAREIYDGIKTRFPALTAGAR